MDRRTNCETYMLMIMLIMVIFVFVIPLHMHSDAKLENLRKENNRKIQYIEKDLRELNVRLYAIEERNKITREFMR